MGLYIASRKPVPPGKAAAGVLNSAARIDHVHSAIGLEQVLFKKIGLNMNVTTDQKLDKSWNFGDYLITEVRFANASVSLTTAAGGIYTAAAKGGIPVIAAAQAYAALTGATLGLSGTLAANSKDVITALDLFLALTTAQGAPATLDVWVIGVPLTEAA